jgi:4-carboxymuconolactone decarboxylase
MANAVKLGRLKMRALRKGNFMNDDEAWQKGQTQYAKLFGEERKPSENETALDQFTITHLFAKVWSRKQLSMPQRSMITVALLAALGRDRELERHVEGALHQGITQEQIIEVMIQVAHYAGWPAGHNGQRIAQEVFKKHPYI